MTEHQSIQDPDEYSDEDMMSFAERLFSPLIPTEELEHICIVLAHLSTEGAQQLLRHFRESSRAEEVFWIETATEEGAFHLLEPQNDLEEQEFLTLKVIEELEDEILDLTARRDELDLKRCKSELRGSAIKALVHRGAPGPGRATGARRRPAL